MKAAKKHFDKQYETYRNLENNPAIPLDIREFIFKVMESYAKEHEDKALSDFAVWLDSEDWQSMLIEYDTYIKEQ